MNNEEIRKLNEDFDSKYSFYSAGLDDLNTINNLIHQGKFKKARKMLNLIT